jgi:hypothetical protein
MRTNESEAIKQGILFRCVVHSIYSGARRGGMAWRPSSRNGTQSGRPCGPRRRAIGLCMRSCGPRKRSTGPCSRCCGIKKMTWHEVIGFLVSNKQETTRAWFFGAGRKGAALGSHSRSPALLFHSLFFYTLIHIAPRSLSSLHSTPSVLLS